MRMGNYTRIYYYNGTPGIFGVYKFMSHFSSPSEGQT